MARPPARGRSVVAKAPQQRGGHPRRQQPARAATARGQVVRGGCPRRARKGRPSAARPRPTLPPTQGQWRRRRRGGQREG
ncbi:hypothetical protein BHE74_00057819 [Ensete ventricosum]|nr:hypothetical protein GW17_00033962 [Ensete ventricosum]RWW37108.1 hypothetical protein BHE74_00057819 [Ensete ventricosum]RZR91667.1 hypothetical protein BHM03_00019843 [Ensete ventricosum]